MCSNATDCILTSVCLVLQDFISAIRDLETSGDEDVLNLAETLGVQGNRERRRLDSALDHSSYTATERDRLRRSQSRIAGNLLSLERQRQGEEADQRERLRRVMSRLSRLDDGSSSANNSNNTGAAYGDRVPSQNSLYDWSPANEADDEDELDHILAELRREQPNTHPEILRVLGRSQLDSERERVRTISSRMNTMNTERAGTGESLRSTAILQSVRRHPRFSARTRDYLSRYNSDRERERENRTGQHSESQQRFLDENNRRAAMQRLQENRNNAQDRERRDMLSRADSGGGLNEYRRAYLDHRTSNPTPPAVSTLLEQTVKYLSQIRQSESIDESVNDALNAGLLGKEHLGNTARDYADFVVDVSTIAPPAQTSWLAPGAVLSGCQHATSVAAPGTTSTSPYATYDASARAAVAVLPHLAPPARPWLANSYNTPRSRTSEPPQQIQPPQQDRWPVKVTIHEVDWEKMTLSATMEAYNVPSHPHSLPSQQQQQYTRTSSITTYLEGEILDFNQHTLLTESFKSSPGTDATYWRKLPPFSGLSDEELIRALTSKKFFREVLGQEWVLMRWKERCFVKSLKSSPPTVAVAPVLPPPISTSTSTPPIPSYHSHLQTPYRLVRDPHTNAVQVEISTASLHAGVEDGQHATFDDSGCGLTISGFYYVALRRSDGGCEGLYFDPQSSPYQCLKLGSRRGGTGGAWGFR